MMDKIIISYVLLALYFAQANSSPIAENREDSAEAKNIFAFNGHLNQMVLNVSKRIKNTMTDLDVVVDKNKTIAEVQNFMSRNITDSNKARCYTLFSESIDQMTMDILEEKKKCTLTILIKLGEKIENSLGNGIKDGRTTDFDSQMEESVQNLLNQCKSNLTTTFNETLYSARNSFDQCKNHIENRSSFWRGFWRIFAQAPVKVSF